MKTNEEKTYYVDSENNIYDAETCKKQEGWTEMTWEEIQSILESSE